MAAESSPNITLTDCIRLVDKLYGLETDESSCSPLDGYADKNFYMKGNLRDPRNNSGLSTVREFVFKVINSDDSMKVVFQEKQTEVMVFLSRRGVNCPRPVKSLNGKENEWIELPFDVLHKHVVNQREPVTHQQRRHVVRLLVYIHGHPLYTMKSLFSLNLFFEVGQYTGQISSALTGFSGEALKDNYHFWDSKNVLDTRKYQYHVTDMKYDNMVNVLFQRLASELIPNLPHLPMSTVHGDMSETNLLVDEDDKGTYYVSGLLDFGSLQYSSRMFDPAITAAYFAMENYPNDVLECSGYVLAGFQSVCPLSDVELHFMPLAMAARMITSLLSGLHFCEVQPDNDFSQGTQRGGWQALKILLETPEEEIFATWKRKFAKNNLEWPA